MNLTHEEREELQRSDMTDFKTDDIALFKLRFATLRDARLYRGTERQTEAEEALLRDVARLLSFVHGEHITKEELER